MMLSLISERESWLHRQRAGAKLAVLSLATVAMMQLANPLALAGCLAVILGLYASARLLQTGLRALYPLRFFVLFLVLYHGLTHDYANGAVITLRLVSALALANLLTLTTRFDDMMDVVLWALAPLKRFGLRPERLALAAALVLRFTPVMAQKGTVLQSAWRARAVSRPKWNILVPWLILAIDDAEHVALALRARGGLGD